MRFWASLMAEECPFCDPEQFVARAVRLDIHHNGFPIYKAVPLNPVVRGHRIFFPKTHVSDAGEDPKMTAAVFRAAAEHASQFSAFNLITSKGTEATQSVFHLHVHVVPRYSGDGLKLPWSSHE